MTVRYSGGMPEPIVTTVAIGTATVVLADAIIGEKSKTTTIIIDKQELPPVTEKGLTSFVPMTRAEVVARAYAQRGLGWYKLGGGAKFTAPDAFAPDGNQYPNSCDCSGLVAYCLRYRRGSYNTDGITRDALHTKNRFRLIERGEPIVPSDIIVRPGPDENGDGKRDSPGHVGIVTNVLPGFVRGGDEWWKFLEVTHCSGRLQNTIDTLNVDPFSPKTGKRYGAVRSTDASVWKSSGYLVRALHVR